MIINTLQLNNRSNKYHILLYDILSLPVDELAFLRIEVDSDHRDLLRGLKILLEVGFFLDLRQRGIVIVQLELKQIDVIIRLDNRIDPPIVRAGLRFDVESEQPEDRVEDGLERRFTLLVDRIRHPCEERFENLPRLIQIALQERGKIAVETTGSAGGLFQPYKGMIPACPSRGFEFGSPVAPHPRTTAQAVSGLLLLTAILSRERIKQLRMCQFVFCQIFHQLVSDILSNHFFITAYGINKVAATPKMTVAILVFQLSMTVKDHQRTFTLQITYKLRYTQIRGNTHQHMNMIWTQLGFFDYNSFTFA